MKKMLLQNWFLIVVFLVLGIKYGCAQQTKWDKGNLNPAADYIKNKQSEKPRDFIVPTDGFQAVKKYDLPVYIRETNLYTVENINNEYYRIKMKRTLDHIDIDYQDYQDIISFFYELVKAEPNAKNYNYQIVNDKWYVEIHKNDQDSYFGDMGYVVDGKKSRKQYLGSKDVLFLASLPLDLEE